MTDKTLEAVARAIGNTTDFDGDRMASRYADSELRDMAQAAITAARPLIMEEGWQPIETAPRDGTPVMLFARCIEASAPCRVIGWYLNSEDRWIELAFVGNSPVGLVPTLWQPLPAFPVTR